MENIVDPEASLKRFKLLQETQSQIEILNNQVAKIKKRIANQQIKHKRCEAALEELDNTPGDRKVYKQVSRLLILRESSELKETITAEKEKSLEDIPKLNSVKAQLLAKLGGLNGQLVQISTSTNF